MKTDPDVKQAIEDIHLIRGVVDGMAEERGLEVRTKVNRLNVQLHRIALLASILVLVPELSGGMVTKAIMSSSAIPALKTYGIVNIASLLMLIGAYVYAQVFSFVRRNKKSKVYVSKYFSYLENYRFASDLLVKFVPVLLIVMMGRPEFLAPLFVVYIADYLFQGRFFRFARTNSVLLGVGCLSIGVSMAVWGLNDILIPALLFYSITLLSLCFLKAEEIEFKGIV